MNAKKKNRKNWMLEIWSYILFEKITISKMLLLLNKETQKNGENRYFYLSVKFSFYYD